MQRIHLPRFKKILFCLPLRGGVIVLVYINLIIISLSVFGFAFLDLMKTFVRVFTMSSYEMQHRAFRSKIHVLIIVPILIVFLLSEIGFMVTVLIGLHKDKIHLVKLYQHFAVLVTVFIMFFRMFDVSHYHWYIDLAVVALFLLFKIYYILSIRSLVKVLEEPKEVERLQEDIELMLPQNEFENISNNGEFEFVAETKDFDNFVI